MSIRQKWLSLHKHHIIFCFTSENIRAGGSRQRRQPPYPRLCWVVYEISLKDSGYCVTAGKVIKRANSVAQSEDSCKEPRARFCFNVKYEVRGLALRRKSAIKVEKHNNHVKKLLARIPSRTRFSESVCFVSTERGVPFISAYLGGMQWLWKGVDLGVLWCSH